MLQGCLTALRQQIWPTFVGGNYFQIGIRTAKRKHLRILMRRRREAQNRAKAKEKVVDNANIPFAVRMQKLKQSVAPQVRVDDIIAGRFKVQTEDDVWLQKYFLPRLCTLHEALQFHREACHPSVLNMPDAEIHLDMELNMKLEKSRVLDKATGVVLLPHADENKIVRSVVAVCKNPEDQAKALEAGAEIATDQRIVSMIEKGELKLDSFAYLVCHVDSIADLMKLRAVLKKRFPDKKRGSLGTDIEKMVRSYSRGLEYESVKDVGVLQYANLSLIAGRLSMPNEHVEENVQTIVTSLYQNKGPEHGRLINKCIMRINGSAERFRVDLQPYSPKAPEKSAKGSKGKKPEAVIEEEKPDEEKDDEEKKAAAV